MRKTLENVPHLIWNGHDESVLCNDKLSDDLNIVSAIKFTLDYINRPVSKTEVAGLTGAAFYIGWNAEHLFSGMGGAVFLFPREQEKTLFESPGSCHFGLMFRYAGIDYEIIKKGNGYLWSRGCASIDNGIPVIAVEWNPVNRRGHSVIICGYDSKEKKFLGRIYEHEKSNDLVHIFPHDLHYAIVLTPDGSWKGKPSGVAMRKFAIESLANAAKLLQGTFFNDEEKWQLGIGCYDTQAHLVVGGLNPDDNEYSLKEHFLFWRMQILLLCRSYACEYLRFLQSWKVFAGEDLLEARDLLKAILSEYESLKDFFKSKLIVRSDLESIVNGSPLSWIRGDDSIPVKQLFTSETGRREFASFLLDLKQIEEKALSLLMKF